jgi:ribonuclease G
MRPSVSLIEPFSPMNSEEFFMSKELVISANRHETKVAILEDDQLVEVFFQRANEYSLAGSIHKGRVTRVLPGMQSAFVDLGLERDTFLYVSDFFEEAEEDFDRLPEPRRDDPRRERENRPPVSLREVPRDEEPGARTESEVVSSSEPGEAAAPFVAPKRSEDDGRDRRGRSRRRRNRGRGFPESKYASSESRGESRSGENRPNETRSGESRFEGPRGPRPVEAQHAAESRDERPEPGSGADAFSVLPGESLAKYRGANIAPLDEAEEEEVRSLQSPPEEAEVEAEVEASIEAQAILETAAEAAILLGEPAVEVAAPEQEAESETVAEILIEDEAGEPEDAFQEAPADEEPPPSGEIESERAMERAAEAGGAALEEPSGSDQPSDSPESPAPVQELTAQVREQSGRFGHRMPRRMRRKMRGGGAGGPDSRIDPERRGESGVPVGVPPEARVSRPEPTRGAGRPERAPMPSISELLKEGQEIIVQIAKEPLGQKGARITSHIALPGRYVVYMPTVEHTGVSRKIASDEERQRLKRILQIHHAGVPGGFIVRTAGEGKSEEDIATDMNFLANLWIDIRQKAEKRPAPLLLHHDLDIVQRTLRDQFTEEFKDVWVDNEDLYERILGFVQRFHPSLVPRVKLYTRPEPIFDAFNITAELEKALRPKVWLKSGGYIVINQTEALVAIDVNTGKYVGRSNRLEDTIVKTNTEAVKEIVRQVRLRDLGGIIVVDFIDMDERKNRQKVMQALEDAMRADRAPYKILQFNDFGLVAITRKRVKQSLERALCMPCPHCEGAGYVKSVQTIVGEILQEAHKIASSVEGKDAMLRVHPDVAKLLKSNQNKYLEELEEILRRPVLVRADPLLHHEKFDLT